ncbi:A/G-specific adenine glycosylase [Anaerotaenia torta]|uniref:A/G-specific adenine glycosylase n=1 Tax=Anaerotaenia torta TaxID=433293 RepID=UPI003D21636C
MRYDYSEIVPYLLHWFEYNARVLAWRENPRPYYVWVSEIMLQQTRVEAVKGYFDRFITALPGIEALADADEDRLLKLWEGLGYYNRVRNMKKAAVMVMEEHGGEMPAGYEKLLALPGVGEYTAGAIASIAFGIPVPAVDGNVLRVMKRIAGSFDDITRASVKKELWQDMKEIIPRDNPGNFNQSLMELGATVCLPNGKPLCDSCPVMHLCRAFHEGIQMQLPVKPEKKERRREERTILLLEYQDRYAIRKRLAKGLLAGLWELPGITRRMNREEVRNYLSVQGMDAEQIGSMGEAKHIFSHVEWDMTGYHVLLKELPQAYTRENAIIWADRTEINEVYSIPNAFGAYTKSVKC